MNAWVWTAMMIGGSLQTLVFIPAGAAMDVFQAPMLGFGQSAISHLYLPAFVLAAVASIGGAWAWTIASQRLPMALASQLLSMEMVFATCLGLLFYYRWSTAPEAMGITLIVVGVVKAIGAFRGNPVKLLWLIESGIAPASKRSLTLPALHARGAILLSDCMKCATFSTGTGTDCKSRFTAAGQKRSAANTRWEVWHESTLLHQ